MRSSISPVLPRDELVPEESESSGDAPVRQHDDDAELCAKLERHVVLVAVGGGAHEVRHLARELAARLAAEREDGGVQGERVGLGELRGGAERGSV